MSSLWEPAFSILLRGSGFFFKDDRVELSGQKSLGTATVQELLAIVLLLRNRIAKITFHGQSYLAW